LFSSFISPVLTVSSIKRIRQIIREHSLNSAPIPREKKIVVKSVNDESTIKLIQSINPDIIIVNSTGIIKRKLILSVKSLFLNIHCGILPMYRGYSGGYWALVKKDRKHCGSTIHILDEGIDTGPILQQGTIAISKRDNYATYDFLHLATEIGLLRKAVHDAMSGNIRMIQVNGKVSARFYGPTIWGYFYNRIVNKVK
jgi:methionyl-tRNA formyltransferase